MKKPYATDWTVVSEGVEYSAEHKMWWDGYMVYDELSARHNGIIGAGARLKKIIRREDERT